MKTDTDGGPVQDGGNARDRPLPQNEQSPGEKRTGGRAGGAPPGPSATADVASGTEQRPIVAGIGASAGGVEALQAFFEAVPEGLGVAFVVVVHLSPEHRSELADILDRRTHLTVQQVEDTMDLEGDCVYVIPPDRRLEITDTHIGAFPFEEPRGQRAPIDTFFRSLASQHGDGFGVILSGGGSDGAVGVKAIKEAGGLILVQDPNEAAFDSMPRAAIATEVADLVLPVRDLAGRLADLTHTKRRIRETVGTGEPAQLDGNGEKALGRILTHLHARTGHDFTKYKRSTVLRRVGRRMQVHRKETLADYLAFLRQNIEEAQALFEDMLISVTTFFRDPEAWAALAETVIPTLFDRHAERDDDEPLRLWVPGCATGEEAYSLAILLLEEAERRDIWPEVQVFASDLDEGSLATAREGRYPAAVEADLSPERLRRFFVPEGNHVRVTKEVRDCVLFASHSLLRDPPFSRLDLVSCRNLLIYLDRDLQGQVFGILRYALRASGFLFLGSSESAEGDHFRTLDKRHRIFQARDAGGELPHLPELLARTPRLRTPAEHERSRREPPPPQTLHRALLEDLAPPSLVVDERRQVLHLSETVGRFLQPPGGAPTRDATELVRPELQAELRAALFRAVEHDEQTLSPFVPVQFNGTPQRVALLVRPRAGEDGERLTLVVFIEGGEAVTGIETADGEATDEIVDGLQTELRQTQDRMRTAREENEATVEELRATNEELQSVNEEYRSTAEELETSKEELQSLNEELQTVNAELKNKLDEVSRAHSDLENLMAATEIGTLFLDRQLRIRRFTPQIADLFSVTLSDRGRPIADFTHRLRYDGLEADARQVLADLQPVEHEVRSEDGQWFLVRLRPYRSVDDRIDGVVVTFVDITTRRAAEQAVRAARQRLEQTLEHLPVGVVLADTDGALVYGNPTVERIFAQPFIETGSFEEYGRWPLFRPDADEPFPLDRMPMTRSLTESEVVVGEEMRIRRPDGSFRHVVVNTAPILGEDGNPIYGVAAFIDLTERREAEEALRQSEERYRLLFESVEEYAIFTLDTDGAITSWNSGAEALFGYTDDEALGQPGAMIFTKEDRAAKVPEHEMATAEKTGTAKDDRWHVRKDGSRFWVSGVMTTLRHEDGSLRGFAKVLRDNTERKEAEDALRQREAQLDLAQQAARAGLFVQRFGVAPDYGSEAWLELMGYTAEDDPEAFTRWLDERVHPDDRDLVEAASSAAQRGEDVAIEYRIQHPERGERWMLSRGRYVPPEGDAPPRLIGITLDITEQKNAEVALRESEAQVRRIIDNMLNFVAVLDAEGTVLDVNRAALAVADLARADVIGKKFWACFWWTFDPAVSARVEEAVRHAATGEVVRHDLAFRTATDERRIADVMLTPVRDEEGVVRYLIPSGVDITDRKEAEVALRRSEARYRSLFESIDEGFCIVEMLFDEDGTPTDYRFIETNPMFEEQTGLTDPVGKTARTLVPDLEDHWVQAHGEVARTGEPMRFMQGSEAMGRWFDVYSFRAPGREPHHVAILFKDITEQKRNDLALRRINETLEERVAERTEQVRTLASTLAMAEQNERRRIAHVLHDDLQQLLFGIQLKMTFVRQGAEALGDPTLAEHATESEDFLDRAIQVSRELTVDLSPPVLAGEGLTHALEWLTTQMDEVHGLTVEVRAEQSFVIPREGMRVLLFQVVRELLFNVVKHAATERATVTIGEADEGLIIVVEDEGTGFDPAALQSKTASGFGLFSVRERLRLFGGTLEIESAPGEGTRMTAKIPAILTLNTKE